MWDPLLETGELAVRGVDSPSPPESNTGKATFSLLLPMSSPSGVLDIKVVELLPESKSYADPGAVVSPSFPDPCPAVKLTLLDVKAKWVKSADGWMVPCELSPPGTESTSDGHIPSGSSS